MKVFGYNIQKESINKQASEEVSKAATPKAAQSAVGVIGLKVSSGFIKEEFLTALQWPRSGKVYQEMSSNDAIVGGCLYLIETLIGQAVWKVKAASADAGDVEAAEFVRTCMFDMQGQSWNDFINDALSMLTYGFSFHEIVYKVRRGPLEKDAKFKSNYTDGKFGWQCLPIRSQSTLSEWTYDPLTGDIIEFVQDPSIVGLDGPLVNIPVATNLLFKTKNNRSNPEGWSILRRAYRSWYFKKYIEELEGIGIERNLAGIPVLSPPIDINLMDAENEQMVKMLGWAQQLVNGLRQDRSHGIVLPNSDWKLSLLGNDGSSKTIDTDTIIRRHETRMAMSMLSDILILGGDRTGSFALAETKQGLFIQSLQSIINSITSLLNTKAVPALFAVNGWTVEKLPEICTEPLNTPSIKEIALLLRSFKMDITKNRELFNFVTGLMKAPEMDEASFQELLALNEKEIQASNPDVSGDSIDGDMKQSDQAYTEGGE